MYIHASFVDDDGTLFISFYFISLRFLVISLMKK